MFKTFLGMAIGALGALGGFAFYKLVGCPAGTCPITSSAFLSTFSGALIGFIMAGILMTESGRTRKRSDETP